MGQHAVREPAAGVPCGKYRYASRGEAVMACRGLKRKGRKCSNPSRLEPYACPDCGCFHVGHRPARWRRDV